MKLLKNQFYAIVKESQTNCEIIEQSHSEKIIYKRLRKYPSYNIYVVNELGDLIVRLTNQ